MDIANQVYLQYGALGLLAVSGWAASWIVWKELTRTREKLDTLQASSLTQLAELGNILKDLMDNRRLEDLVRELSKR